MPLGVAAFSLLAACEQAPAERARAEPTSSTAAAGSGERIRSIFDEPEGTSPAAAASAGGQAPSQADAAWAGPVSWRTWEDGLAEAQRSGKPMLVLVHAPWCPKCRALQPVFRRDDVVAASRELVMVLQDQDQAPPWLEQRFGEHGSYVPRIFFLDSKGQLRADISSGHPRFPYFYHSSQVDDLLRSMRTAASKS